MKFVRPKEVLALLGVSRSTLWRLCRDGGFPRPIRIASRRSGFVEEDVERWMEARATRAAGGVGTETARDGTSTASLDRGETHDVRAPRHAKPARRSRG